MATTVRPRVRSVKHFALHVYGYSGDGDDLADLPGWPQSLIPFLQTEVEGRDETGPTLLRFTSDDRDFTLEEACEVLTALRKNNLGYRAFITPALMPAQFPQVVYVWCVTSDASPQLSKEGPERWVELAQKLLEATVVEGYPQDLPGSREVAREFRYTFEYNVQSSSLADLNKLLGG